jgi:PAS domain S-box-containing protein
MTGNWKTPPLWLRCLVTLLIVAAASVIRAMFFGGLGRGIPYLTYYPAVMLAALYGGLLAGFLAAALSGLLIFFWVQQGFMSPIESLAMAVFFISCTMIAFICEAMLRAQARPKLAQEKAETANQELQREVAERKRAEGALRETNEYLENLFNYANTPIIVWDPQFRITRFNHAFESLTGRKPADVIGGCLDVLFPPSLVESSMELIRKTLTGEHWQTVEIPTLHLDGSIRTVLWNSATIFAPDGETPVATIAQGQDITERQRAEEKLRWHNRELSVLATVRRAIAESRNLQQVLDRAVETTLEVLEFDGGGIFLLEPDGETMQLRASHGHSDEFVHKVQRIKLGEGVSGRAAAEKKAILLDVAKYPTERIAPFIIQEGIQMMASTPLLSGGELIGALNLASRRPRVFPPKEMELLAALGQLLGPAVQNAQLLERVQRELAERNQAEAALLESEQRFRILFEQANDGMMLADAETKRITLANRQIQQMLGYSEDELFQLTVADIHPAADLPAVFKQFEQQARGEFTLGPALPMRRKDGTVFYADINTTPVRLQQHNCLLGVFRDITERKRADEALRESDSRFRQLAESLPQLVWTCQPDGACDYFNRQWIEFTGVPEAQQFGFGWLEQLHPDDRGPTVAAWEAAVATSTNFRVEFRIRRHDGEYRWFDTQAVRLCDAGGHTVKWFGSNTDMTERKRAEEAIHQLNIELEERVRDRTAELQAANKELEAFSYSVSHDLRAPLRAMDGFSMTLLKNHAGQLDESAQHCLRRIRANSQQMAGLIDDLLNLAQLTREKMRRKRVDLTAMAEKIGAELRQMNPERAVELVVAPALAADADEGMVHVVLNNLLGNAWKFTAGRAPARVEVGAREQDGERGFFVRDNGAGFDMAYAGKLFGAFQRLHSVHEFEGNGIGLALVQRIVNRHGGRVWAEGAVGQGATIYFTFGNERS